MSIAPIAPSTRHAATCPSGHRAIRRRVSLFDVEVDPLTMQETVDAVLGFVRCGAPHQHVCLNAAKVVELEARPDLRRAISSCDLVSVDGQAVVWASRILGARVPERVAGVDLFQRLLAVAAERGLGVYLLGARQEVVDEVVRTSMAQHPGLRVVGARSGYWSPEEEHEVVTDVARSGADLLFLAVPSPRKELFLEEHGEALGVPFRMGVGGSFDVVAGVVKRAPLWAQRAGLEWAYRLAQEPRRLLRRYLVGNSAFVLLVLRQRFGMR
jgi:N-acetylglucosaminyldiphosphoundecaprenol N-acetyl-beta-D-mannosaminyltransferase